MEQNLSLRFIRISSILFIVASLFEIINLFMFSFVPIRIENKFHPFIELLLQPEIISVHGLVLYLSLSITIFLFFFFGAFQYIFASFNLKEKRFANYLIVFGMFIITGSFVKLAYIVFLGNTSLKFTTGVISLENALYTPFISPPYGILFWNLVLSVISAYLLLGLITGGLGISWIVKIRGKTDET